MKLPKRILMFWRMHNKTNLKLFIIWLAKEWGVIFQENLNDFTDLQL